MSNEPLPAKPDQEVVLARQLDEFPEGQEAVVVEADRAADSYQLRVETLDGPAFIEARRGDFLVVLTRLPRPAGTGDGIAYTSDTPRLKARGYGLSEEDYDRMLAEQEGCCAICERHAEVLGQPLGVDHDHGTKAVRGLLCDDCNLGLGKFRDRIDLLDAASVYLRRHGSGVPPI